MPETGLGGEESSNNRGEHPSKSSQPSRSQTDRGIGSIPMNPPFENLSVVAGVDSRAL